MKTNPNDTKIEKNHSMKIFNSTKGKTNRFWSVLSSIPSFIQSDINLKVDAIEHDLNDENAEKRFREKKKRHFDRWRTELSIFNSR